MKIGQLRRSYNNEELTRESVPSDPFALFDQWLEEALAAESGEPNAVALATADKQGLPSLRYVLLKEYSPEGFLFYTNHQSRKALEIRENPHAALCFFWEALIRQVRVEGTVERLSDQEADEYFAERPRESQLAAWASKQDQPIESRAKLEEAYERYRLEFEGGTVPRPDYWGGYRLLPTLIEFWLGRPNRMHDRFCYKLEGGVWAVQRLSP